MCCRIELPASFFSPFLFTSLFGKFEAAPVVRAEHTHTQKSGFDFPPGRDAMLTGDIHTRGKERKVEAHHLKQERDPFTELRREFLCIIFDL